MCYNNKKEIQIKILSTTPPIIRIRRIIEAHFYKFLLRFYLFGAKFIELPIIGKSISNLLNWYGVVEHGGKVIPKEEAYYWIEKANSILRSICYCRATLKNCSNFITACLRLSDTATFANIDKNYASFISKQEAKQLIEEAEKNGLIHIIVWCKFPYVYAICNCCSCCCVAYLLWKRHNIRSGLQKSDWTIKHEKSSCSNCTSCINLCKFGAIKINKNKIEFDANKCFGCGLCRQACKQNALTLTKQR